MLPLRAVLARWSVPRGFTTTAVARDSGKMAQDAVGFYNHMKRDFLIVVLLAGLGSVVGYTTYNIHASRDHRPRVNIGFTTRLEKFLK